MNVSWVIKAWLSKSSVEAGIPVIVIIICKKVLLYKSEIKALVSLSDILLIEVTNYIGFSLRSRGIDFVLLVLSKAKD
jgi:hypothetical protein